ncbi:hypothetical protein Q3G72_005370 [Acer saccharum]|nr:hypothetical protein Q3G72_005370 [Acer saccharum]
MDEYPFAGQFYESKSQVGGTTGQKPIDSVFSKSTSGLEIIDPFCDPRDSENHPTALVTRDIQLINPRHPKVKVETRHQMVKAKHVEAPHTETTTYIKSACMYRTALVTRDIQLTGGIQVIRSNQLPENYSTKHLGQLFS